MLSFWIIVYVFDLFSYYSCQQNSRLLITFRQKAQISPEFCQTKGECVMFTTNQYPTNEEKAYELLIKQAAALLEDEPDSLANFANTSALLGQFLKDINWVGFYFMKDGGLVLGPFQGLPACTRISIGKGVCGTAVAENKTMLVADVHEFPGHIACDAASNSEIVIPIRHNGEVVAVLDIDSPLKNRFSTVDQLYLEKLIKTIEPYLVSKVDN